MSFPEIGPCRSWTLKRRKGFISPSAGFHPESALSSHSQPRALSSTAQSPEPPGPTLPPAPF